MKYIAIIFITILTFVIPVNINAQDSEDIVFELLFETLDSLEVSQRMITQAERIVGQERQTNDSLHTVVEVLEQNVEQNKKDRNASFFIICCGVLGWWLHKRKKK